MPEIITDYLPVLALLLAAGALAGFIAGLLGVGGGIVIIPVLYMMFDLLDVGGAWRMHMAVATSLLIIIATNLSSVRAHNRKGGVLWPIVRDWWLALVFGSVSGMMLAKQLQSDVLVFFFVALVVFIAVKMLLPLDGKLIATELPKGKKRFVAPAVIGLFSTIMGIGGGSFSVPYLTLYGVAIRQAVGTASLAGLVISVTGSFSFIIGGLGEQGLPDFSLGFIYLPAFVIIAPVSVLCAPLGATVAHKISHRALSVIFGLFLLSATTSMLLTVL